VVNLRSCCIWLVDSVEKLEIHRIRSILLPNILWRKSGGGGIRDQSKLISTYKSGGETMLQTNCQHKKTAMVIAL